MTTGHMTTGAEDGMTKGAQTRRSVLDAAVERFGRDGFRATSVADIARDAGVGGSVPYAYFSSKEDLFLAALDRDAGEVMAEGLSLVFDDPHEGWRQDLMPTLVRAVEAHPLARRVLAGLEPDVTDRVAEIPALVELRAAVAQRLAAEQKAGTVRDDIDPEVVGAGLVSVTLSLLMTVLQVGPEVAATHAAGIVAVFSAAVDPPAGA
jgi:AcrR family transcriptional regulator